MFDTAFAWMTFQLLGLISGAKISIHKASLALDLMLFVKQNIYLQPDTDNINKTCFLIWGTIFHCTQYYIKCMHAARKTSVSHTCSTLLD